MSLTRASYVLRFSVSCFRYTEMRFSEALDAARGLNTRTSKKAYVKKGQKLEERVLVTIYTNFLRFRLSFRTFQALKVKICC